MDRYRLLPSYHYYDVEGNSPLTLDKSVGKPLRDYKIYGNSVQDGTPTPENPIEIQCVGDLVTDETDANYGKYKIPIEDSEEVTNIYIDEPLYKIGDYADYIDFMNSKVVRNIIHKIFKGTEGWMKNDVCIYLGASGVASSVEGFSTHFEFAGNASSILGNVYFRPVADIIRVYQRKGNEVYATVDDWKTFLQEQYQKGTSVEGLFRLNTPIEQPIDLPTISTHKGTNFISVGTTIQPSNIKIQYYK